MLMRLMSNGEYLIVPKGTKFKGSGKLGLITHKFDAIKQNELELSNTFLVLQMMCSINQKNEN